ncbi:beta-eliminating lyase domain-containing protein [Ditylenchus destructor]|nr:beta-eliminating lyase domain-containing protein [Ditylenchus destructor]
MIGKRTVFDLVGSALCSKGASKAFLRRGLVIRQLGLSSRSRASNMINLTSDNWTGAHPKISEALLRQSAGSAIAYGASELDRKIEDKFAEIFEKHVAVYFVGTGTAANALAMAYVNLPGGIIFAHRNAHLIEDECGAPEYITGGARTYGVSGSLGQIDSNELVEAIKRYPQHRDFVHAGQPMAVTITQTTESGTLYSLPEIRKIADIAHSYGLPLHMDGARFANALVGLGCTPAEMTWKNGVDILSFGATKNGCWCAEAIIVFNDRQKAERNFPYLRKRAAHLFSKTRFIAAQFEAYFNDDLWIKNARHANRMAGRLLSVMTSAANNNVIKLAWPVQANEVFVVMKRQLACELQNTKRVSPFYEWNVPEDERQKLVLQNDEGLYRLVTTFATTEEDIDEFGKILKQFC